MYPTCEHHPGWLGTAGEPCGDPAPWEVRLGHTVRKSCGRHLQLFVDRYPSCRIFLADKKVRHDA